ncbi:MAG: class I SAM-dependent methyltransferase [Dysgonamonadaceae bacterium]|jgi:hypothetical protein|nr:class I SAM-dependent methyltransferase [Dysgonamonadaceae bacterium]
MDKLKQLSSDQLESFNTEYVNGELWDAVVNFIDRDFITGEFTFLDIGGGNGMFTDRILAHYPKSHAILLDNAKNLIEINKENPRKKIILDSVENLETYLSVNHVDIVFINWVLHHLVSNTYRQTRQNIENTLKVIRSHRDVHYLAIFENMYNGIWFDNLPSRLIFQLTSFKPAKMLMKRMGANTAGVGVSFLSMKKWMSIFDALFGRGSYQRVDFGLWNVPLIRKLFLHIKTIHMSLFWINNNSSPE